MSFDAGIGNPATWGIYGHGVGSATTVGSTATKDSVVVHGWLMVDHNQSKISSVEIAILNHIWLDKNEWWMIPSWMIS